MKHLATCLILCFVASCLMVDWSAARAAEPDKSPADQEAVKDDKPKDAKSEKAADKKPAAVAEKQEEDKDAKKEGDKDKTKKDDPDKKDAENDAKKKAPVPAKKPVHELKKGPFEVAIQLKGLFEAKRMTEVILWPERWSSYTVLRAAEHGQHVKQGDLLIAFDPEKIDQTIDDLRRRLKLTNIEIRKIEEQVRSLEKLEPMDLAAVDRRQRIAQEDFEQLMKVDLPLSKKIAGFYLKKSAEELAYAKEELRQLDKMYKADDLTEETEEIILRRARFEVSKAEFSYKLAKQQHEEVMKFYLPRREESAKDSIERTTLSNKQAKVLLPLTLKKSRLELEKAKVERERLDKDLKEMLADRALMTVKSPTDGILYFGECVDGNWTGLTSADKFRRGATLPPKKVLMTVVQSRPILIQSAATEKDIRYLREGLKGKATPTAYPKARLEAVVAEVATVPDAGKNFDLRLMVTNQNAAPVMPGMTCTVKLVVYKKDKALTIPPTALGTDTKDDAKHFVHVVDKDGKSKRRPVKVGERTAKEVEILKGLSAGDKILKDCPKDDDKPKK